MTKKLGSLKAQAKQLSDACADLRNITEATEQHILSHTGDEILDMSLDISDQIAQKKLTYGTSGDDKNEKKYSRYKVQPVVNTFSDVSVQSTSGFTNRCNELARVVDREVLFRNGITVTGLKDVEYSEMTSSFSIRSKTPRKFECRISRHQSSTKCDTSRVGSYWYRVQYTVPKTPGRYKIHVLADGKNISNSPFSVSVKKHDRRRQGYDFI